MVTRTWDQSWQKALALYRSFDRPSLAYLRRFEDIVAQLASSKEVRGLYAITSHETLIITPYSYPDFMNKRRVCASPLPTDDVEISRYDHRRQPAEQETVPIAACRVHLLELAERYL